MATLWPPKPKELLSAADDALGQRALLGGDVEADVLGVVEVDGRRHDAVVQREDRGERLQRAGRTEQVPGHRLGARSTMTPAAASPRALRIAPASAMSPCGVEVAWALMWCDVGRRHAGVAQRHLHRPGGPEAGRVGLRDVVGVGGDAGAQPPRRRPWRRAPRRAPRTRAPSRRALAEHEAVAALVPRPRRGRRGRRCASTAPSSGRRRPSAAGAPRPRCRRPRRRRRGRAGSCRCRARSPRCPTRTPRPACARRPWRRRPGRCWRRGSWASASGSPAGRPGAGPSP